MRRIPLPKDDFLSPRVRYCVRTLKRAEKAFRDGRIERVWYEPRWIRYVNRNWMRGYRKHQPWIDTWDSIKKSVKKGGVPFNLTREEVRDIYEGARALGSERPALGRLKPKLGWVRGNVVAFASYDTWNSWMHAQPWYGQRKK